MKNNNDEGFTLIELLIVIVILGILATVVVFSVRGITDQGQDNACSADVRTMEVAVEAYYAKYGNLTIDSADLVEAELIRAESDNSYVVAASGEIAGSGDCDTNF